MSLSVRVWYYAAHANGSLAGRFFAEASAKFIFQAISDIIARMIAALRGSSLTSKFLYRIRSPRSEPMSPLTGSQPFRLVLDGHDCGAYYGAVAGAA